MRLKKEQKEKLLEWVAEGLSSPEINKRAAVFDPAFSVSRQQVDFYRTTRRVSLEELIKQSEHEALNSGLALKAERVKRLQMLAGLMEDDLFAGQVWIDDIKGIGSGDIAQIVEFERFNQAEINEYRATLDQIAEEVGDKKPDQLIPSEITVRFVKPDGSGPNKGD